MKKKIRIVAICFVAILGIIGVIKSQFFTEVSNATSQAASPETYDFNKVPIKGMVTMIDLGAKSCIPCKMMAPTLEKIEKIYRDKAAIVFIDVWENKKQAGRFGIRAIPTQIFFNRAGKEIFRHVGFMSEKDIVDQLKKMGVN